MLHINSLSKRLAILAAVAIATSGAALAQDGLDTFQQPVGFGFGEQDLPVDSNTRDINGNRIVIDGLIIQGNDLSNLSRFNLGFGLGSQALTDRRFQTGNGFGQGQTTVAGNQLNVITQGSNNVVVIDSTQINNGDQTVVLNGELDLND